LSIISANVSGIPSYLTKYDRDVKKCQETLGKMLNESGHDIICMQEDFQYHDVLVSVMTNYTYQTYDRGYTLLGTGLNIFSKYPIYNVEHIAWEKYNGIFFDGADAFSPKGFIKCTVDVDGVLIDLYNLHGDSYRTEADQLAKKAQLIQLSEYIDKHSSERPIIITGDTNLTFHNDPLAEMYRILIVEDGFTDTWVETKNGGNYFQGDDGQALIDAWYNKFGGHDWGRWDSVERVLYRNGDGLKFKPTRFEYKIYTDNKDQIKALTDHRIMECTLKLDISEYQKPKTVLEKENKPSWQSKIFYDASMILRFVFFFILGVIELIFSNVYSATAFIGLIALIAFLFIRRIRRKKGR
ncbi:MAG: endonuclease/exonuclease/phosphatase family protein, partial [Clostridia bacterium]|nr:endonuclease/exonuclease/phosphatase family protein [Clostridia bacterium]